MNDTLIDRARALRLHGLVAHWEDAGGRDWPAELIAWEEEERRSRSQAAPRGPPRASSRSPTSTGTGRAAATDGRRGMGLDSSARPSVVLVGPNGVGSTIAANIAHRAVLDGHTVRFATAASMLGELATIDSDSLLQRKLGFRPPEAA